MKLSELQSKKIVNMENGKNIGSIIDVDIDNNGTIGLIMLESAKGIFNINKELDENIRWKDIEKIGEDVILIKKDVD